MHETRFEFDDDGSTEDDRPDIYVTEVFENGYGDLRAKLDGDTYEAKDVIKFDWDTTHHDFDGSDKTWVVDADSLEELDDRLADAGFTFRDTLEGDNGFDNTLEAIHAFAEQNDDITVEYRQKNGEGTNEKHGRVVGIDRMKQDAPRVAFRRHGDNHYMYLEPDEYGNPSLWTGGSHAPYVGELVEVTVETTDPRERGQPDDTDDSTDADDVEFGPGSSGGRWG